MDQRKSILHYDLQRFLKNGVTKLLVFPMRKKEKSTKPEKGYRYLIRGFYIIISYIIVYVFCPIKFFPSVIPVTAVTVVTLFFAVERNLLIERKLQRQNPAIIGIFASN